eukprot:m51a1_g3292 hypothetical protein (308) ;mRNA; r:280188-281404
MGERAFYCPRDECEMGPKLRSRRPQQPALRAVDLPLCGGSVLACLGCGLHLVQCENCFALTDDDEVDYAGSRPLLSGRPGLSSGSNSQPASGVSCGLADGARWAAVTCRRCGHMNVTTAALRRVLFPELPPVKPLDPSFIRRVLEMEPKDERDASEDDLSTPLEARKRGALSPQGGPGAKRLRLDPKAAAAASGADDEGPREEAATAHWTGPPLDTSRHFSGPHMRMLASLYSEPDDKAPTDVLSMTSKFLEAKAEILRSRRELCAASCVQQVAGAVLSSKDALSGAFAARYEHLASVLWRGSDKRG